MRTLSLQAATAILLMQVTIVTGQVEHEASEDTLDALASNHVAEQNKDMFWFAFLIGGVGCIILVVR